MTSTGAAGPSLRRRWQRFVLRMQGRLDGAKSELVALAPTLDFAAAQFDATRPAPRVGTMVDLLDRDPVLTFVIRNARPDGLGRIVCDIAQV